MAGGFVSDLQAEAGEGDGASTVSAVGNCKEIPGYNGCLMENDRPAGAQLTEHAQQPLVPPTGRFRRHWDILAVLLLILVSLPSTFLSRRGLPLIRYPNLLDGSWLLDTSFKASRGLWFGRDVAFTYGPLYQWLSSAPARWMGLSMGAVNATHYILPLWCTFVLGYLTLRLLIPEQPVWKRFLLLLLLFVFWSPPDTQDLGATLKTLIPIFLFALFARGWYAVRQQRLKPLVVGGGAAVLCTLAFSCSADSGVYSIAALLLALAGAAWESPRKRQSLGRYGLALIAFAVVALGLVFAINAIVATPFDFRFWKTSLAIVGGYRWFEPATMANPDALRLLAMLAVGGMIFLLRRAMPGDRQATFTARTGFLLGGFAFAVVLMQSGLVRSDNRHIILATFPMVFFAGTLLFSFGSRVVSAVAALVALAGSLLFGSQTFPPSFLRMDYAHLSNPDVACPTGSREFDGACFPAAWAADFEIISRHIQQRSGPQDSIVVFPYQTMFGIASRRNVAGGVMQSYLASGSRLSQVHIAGLDRAAAPLGYYWLDNDPNLGTNKDASFPLDGIPNFTRNPEIWLWIFRHYRAEDEVLPGIIELRRDDSRAARIVMHTQSLNLAGQSFPIRQRSSVLDLGGPAWPSGSSDLLRLRITVHYSFWWRLRKPERLQLEITRADGSRQEKGFLVEPNVPSEVWFYPWNDADLAAYFAADEARWRSDPRPPITHLRLLVTPLDWVSQKPDSISLDAADSITFTMSDKAAILPVSEPRLISGDR